MSTIDKEAAREENEAIPTQPQNEGDDARPHNHPEQHLSLWMEIDRRLRDAASSPDWLPRPWNAPGIGYAMAVVLPTLASFLMVLVVRALPTFSTIGSFTILTIVGVALLWGFGPGLFATLIGAVTLNYIAMPPPLHWNLGAQPLIETFLFFVIGVAISLTTSRIEKLRSETATAHHETEMARRHLHDLYAQSTERTNQLEAIFDAITDGVFIIKTDGTPPLLNRAARKMLAIPQGTPDEEIQKYPFQLVDEQGVPLPREQWPQERLLQGKRLQGTNAIDIRLQTYNGRTRYLSVTGSPLRDANGNITSTVLVCRDVTERRRIEQHYRRAVNGLIEMSQYLVQTPEEEFAEGSDTMGQDISAITQKLAELARNVLGCERLSITAIDPATGLMLPLGVSGLTPEQEKRWWEEQEQQQSSLAGAPDQAVVRRLLAGEVLVFDMSQPPFDKMPNHYGITTMLAAPMRIGDHISGLLTLDYGGAEHVYTADEQAIAGATAQFVATIIERARLLRQHKEMQANEIALRRTNQRMADLIALAHDAIFVRTPSGIILSWNKGAEQLYGWNAQQAIGQGKFDLLQTRASISREALEEAIERNGRWEGQLIHTCRDGSQVIVDSRQVLVRDEEGNPSTILEINRDISEVERLTRERAEAYARELSMQKTKERMDEFLGITSHELRTPLTTIKGNIQLARLRLKHAARAIQKTGAFPESDLEEMQTMLDRAERQVNVQGRLIRDLLDISRIQVGKLELNMELHDLLHIVREAVEDQRSAAPKRTITLALPESEELPVFADTERISQVVSNYLTNALKYSAADRPIVVSVERQRDAARVAVCDQGQGLTQTEQQQVWERFYRVPGIERQKGFSAGLGLGLHICKAIIEEHQGEVGVESTKGVGSTFWFTLPLAEVIPEENAG